MQTNANKCINKRTHMQQQMHIFYFANVGSYFMPLHKIRSYCHKIIYDAFIVAFIHTYTYICTYIHCVYAYICTSIYVLCQYICKHICRANLDKCHNKCKHMPQQMQTNATTNANKCHKTKATTNANKCHNTCNNMPQQMQTHAELCVRKWIKHM